MRRILEYMGQTSIEVVKVRMGARDTSTFCKLYIVAWPDENPPRYPIQLNSIWVVYYPNTKQAVEEIFIWEDYFADVDKMPYCYIIHELPMLAALSERSVLREKIYSWEDESDSESVCSEDCFDEKFMGRLPEKITFNIGDIVDVLYDNFRLTHAIVIGLPPTVDEMARRYEKHRTVAKQHNPDMREWEIEESFQSDYTLDCYEVLAITELGVRVERVKSSRVLPPRLANYVRCSSQQAEELRAAMDNYCATRDNAELTAMWNKRKEQKAESARAGDCSLVESV